MEASKDEGRTFVLFAIGFVAVLAALFFDPSVKGGMPNEALSWLSIIVMFVAWVWAARIVDRWNVPVEY